MPEFDTYKGIEDYAKHPYKEEARQRFRWLQHAVESKIHWDAIATHGAEKLELSRDLRVGALSELEDRDAGSDIVQELASMPNAERNAAVLRLFESAGIHVDPSALSGEEQSSS